VGGATTVLGLTSKMSGSSPRPCHLRLVGVVKNNSKEKSAKNIFICRRIFIKKEIFLMAGVHVFPVNKKASGTFYVKMK
jgi:hypothetical protein